MTNHYSLLKNGKHANRELQEDYNKGHDFLVICLYRYPDASKEHRREHEEEIQGIIDNLEQEYISEFQAIERGYNKATSAIEYPPPEFGRPTLRPHHIGNPTEMVVAFWGRSLRFYPTFAITPHLCVYMAVICDCRAVSLQTDRRYLLRI